MKILVINCGSTTIKFQLIDMENELVIAKGRCDKIGIDGSNILYKNVRDIKELNKDITMKNHKEAMEILIETLTSKEIGVVENLEEISAVGHRVVHGGEKYSKAVLVNSEVVDEIKKLSDLAPLHNPACLTGIQAIMDLVPTMNNIVVFDTAFHQTIPKYNYLYAINLKYYENYGIRRYGFHGTSYQYILGRLTDMLNKPKSEINAIICHLGGGASICAIKNGKSYDTSMGLTPLEGLVMETRCGDLDPAVVTKLMEKEGFTIEQVNNELNKKSGRLGLCGLGDQRDLILAANSGNENAMLTREIQTNRIKKYIGSYMAELNKVDAIVITGGVGENNFCERIMVLSEMEHLGIEIDEELNLSSSGKEARISKDSSKIGVYVIPTNEELEIARQTESIVREYNGK